MQSRRSFYVEVDVAMFFNFIFLFAYRGDFNTETRGCLFQFYFYFLVKLEFKAEACGMLMSWYKIISKIKKSVLLFVIYLDIFSQYDVFKV